MNTYKDFITKYALTIPEIQRDYVQGSDINKEKRNAFIDNIIEHLENGDERHLDLQFIYGASNPTEENGETIDYFIPIDGQQRLTTLALLGWFLSRKLKYLYNKREHDENAPNPYNWEIKPIDYNVRDTTRQFMKKLFELEQYPETGDLKLSEWLDKVPTWYIKKWQIDPSIRSMLDLLEHLEDRLATYTEEKLAVLANNLYNAEVVIFDTLDMKEYGLSEDLYVKMNARGKHLTEFENWKAEFYGFLKDKYGEETADEFSDKIEGEWGDFLWDYAMRDWKDNVSTGDKADNEYPRIDEYFLRLFYNITDLFCKYGSYDCDLKKGYLGAEYEQKMKTNSHIYSHKIYVNLLFKLIDSLLIIRNVGKENFELTNSVNNCKNYFNTYLFSITDNHSKEIVNKKNVNIFNENNNNVDLVETLLCKDDFPIRPRLLLYGILFYYAKYPQGQNIQDFIRIWWGYILNGKGLRQREKNGFTVGSNIRIEVEKDQRWNLLRNLLTLLKKENPYESPIIKDVERIQSKDFYGDNSKYDSDIIPLLNFPWLQYDIHILDSAIRKFKSGEIYNNFFNKFANLPNKERIPKFIESGFKGFKLTNQQLTYGLTDNWNYMLTGENSNIEESLVNIMSDNFPGISAENKWLTELIYKYIDDLYLQASQFSAFMFDRPYKIYSVPKGRAFKKNGYRLEPFDWVTGVKAGALLNLHAWIPDRFKGIMDGKIKIDMYTEDSRHYGICFTDYGFQMVCNDNGWNLNIYDNERLTKKGLPNKFINRFGTFEKGLSDSTGYFTINNNTIAILPTKNRIETGVDLLNTIVDTLKN